MDFLSLMSPFFYPDFMWGGNRPDPSQDRRPPGGPGVQASMSTAMSRSILALAAYPSTYFITHHTYST